MEKEVLECLKLLVSVLLGMFVLGFGGIILFVVYIKEILDEISSLKKRTTEMLEHEYLLNKDLLDHVKSITKSQPFERRTK